MQYENRTFNDTDVLLDDSQFIGCTLERCNLIYHGAGVCTMKNCSIINCRVTFDGAAQRTLNMLAALYAGGFATLIEATFDNIRGHHKPGSDTLIH